MGFSRQEYWSGLPFPTPGHLLDPGIEPGSPTLAGRFFTTEPPGKYINAMLCYAKSLQSCPTLCDPIDNSPPGSPIPGILQARTLEWVAIAFSNAWKWKVKVKSCATLSDPMDCSLPGSSVHGVFQARVLEWGAIAFSDVHKYSVSNIQIHKCKKFPVEKNSKISTLFQWRTSCPSCMRYIYYC